MSLKLKQLKNDTTFDQKVSHFESMDSNVLKIKKVDTEALNNSENKQMDPSVEKTSNHFSRTSPVKGLYFPSLEDTTEKSPESDESKLSSDPSSQI